MLRDNNAVSRRKPDGNGEEQAYKAAGCPNSREGIPPGCVRLRSSRVSGFLFDHRDVDIFIRNTHQNIIGYSGQNGPADIVIGFIVL